MFACTYIEKLATVDHYENGCETDSICVMSQQVNIVADTLPDLFKRIEDTYGLSIDSLDIPPDQEEGISFVSFNRLENADGEEPTERQKELWKQGDLTLYLCDYTFHIEERTVRPVSPDLFAASGIVTHD